jgi:hypothetical protein
VLACYSQVLVEPRDDCYGVAFTSRPTVVSLSEMPNPLRQIRQPPAHHLMGRRDRAALDDRGQGLTLRFIEVGCLARRLAVDQTGWPPGVETQHPVAHGLQAHIRGPGRVGAGAPVINRRKRQNPPRLRAILRQLAQPRQREVAREI